MPAAIEQLGVKVEYIPPEELAWGNLSRFSTIVTGVRAYERRMDLRANNSRLLEYVNGGGTLIVQYNKFEFNDAQYGPYPAQVSGNRVTDEFAAVNVVAPGDPVLTFPNEISDSTWKGWVQERGLYFLGDRDARYRDLIAIEDPFAYNKGEKRGALVETTWEGVGGPWVVAAIAGRDRWRVPAPGESDQPGKSAGGCAAARKAWPSPEASHRREAADSRDASRSRESTGINSEPGPAVSPGVYARRGSTYGIPQRASVVADSGPLHYLVLDRTELFSPFY